MSIRPPPVLFCIVPTLIKIVAPANIVMIQHYRQEEKQWDQLV